MSIKNMRHVQEYVYDFAVDGGAQGDIELSAKAGKAPIPIGAIITGVTAKVITECTSGGSATIAWGNDDDEDGYSGATPAVSGFGANTIHNGWDNASALLWDDSNDHQIFVNVADADDGEFFVQIATADLTAGKIVFLVDYLMPDGTQ
jgi:hypothetical protein